MKEYLNKNKKFLVLGLFLILAVICVILTGTVKINYNISDYLDDSTDTKISLEIMEEEFGLISNVQVMIDDISPDEATLVKDSLNEVENVVFVNFSSQNESYYKDGTALFVVLVNGNEYSDSAKGALEDITELLEGEYGDRLDLGGTVVEKKLLREAIQSEILLILAISVCLVAILMLLTAASWIEPLVLLAASGVAVLLNMGTNAIFGEISYITNAIASILQLALSIDYSIVLLHSYRSGKERGLESNEAMRSAVREVVRPVSASALTTIAGLFALLFMSFTIGFDIGIVLIKSIVISAITSLTLLPALLLIFDRLMNKTKKPAIRLRGRSICDFSFKAGRFIIPVALVLIVVCCVLNLNNSYNFVDSCNKNENITDKFGDSGTLIVLYENAEDNEEKERLLAELIASYKREDGEDILKSSVAYSSTIGQIYDVEKASRDLGLSEENAELLFMIYRFTEDSSIVKMDIRSFVDFAIELVEKDSDAKDFVSEKTVKALNMLTDLELLLKGEYTAKELGEAISRIELLDGMTLEQSAIDQMYGLYFFDGVTNKPVGFLAMLDFLIDSNTVKDPALIADLNTMLTELRALTPPQKKIGFNDFKPMLSDFGVELDDFSIRYLWTNILGYKVTDTPNYIDLLRNLSKKQPDSFTDELLNIIDNYERIYSLSRGVYEYEKFIPTLKELARLLTGVTPSVEVTNEAIQQLYIMYYVENGRIPDGRIGCIEFLEYVRSVGEENETVAERLPAGALERLGSLITDAKALVVFLSNETDYSYSEIGDEILAFADALSSMDISLSLSDGAMMGLYVKYAQKNELVETGSISATDLLAFVLDASETNEILKSRIDEDMKKTIEESQRNIISAEKLLCAENYSRMLLTVNLPPESAESSRFVEALTMHVREIFGEGAYVAGEIATTNDLIRAFEGDNRLITLVTVVSIFIIIMVVFKSLSLPVILVSIIQGAIWISMSMSLISGSMFFMSYIMSMCILMGATIDYGILLSTNYVKCRAAMDKRESLYRAVDAALPTVFTSGLILMVCGLVVGFVASQTSISSVGFLLFRGTMVSVVMILLVLPAILFTLDKIVIKLTLRRSIREIIANLLKK